MAQQRQVRTLQMSGQSHYKPAAICRRGHVQAANVEWTPFGEKCPTCGAKVIAQCESCGHRIRGYYFVPGVVGGGDPYKPPDFCDKCGAPHPWVSRQGRIYELQNRLESEDLNPADELVVREALDALLSPDLEEEEERVRWARVKRLAPSLWETSQPLLVTLIKEAMLGKL
jgi:hypothetical protein